MATINRFIKRIIKIEKELNILSSEFDLLYKEYEGNDFAEQNKLASMVENQITSLTHEVESELGFGRNDLELLIKYISFRRKYNDFTDNELSLLIDNDNLTIKEKKDIGVNGNELETIKSEWNKVFKNIGYNKLKDKLGITKYLSLYKN